MLGAFCQQRVCGDQIIMFTHDVDFEVRWAICACGGEWLSADGDVFGPDAPGYLLRAHRS